MTDDTARVPDPPLRYELRLRGHLDDHWAGWFDGVTLVRQPDGSTTLHGTVADQAGLHGVLGRVRDLGASLTSVSTTGPGPDDVQPTLPRPVRTERLLLRPATADDLQATWAYRCLDSVNHWITRAPATLEDYRAQFEDPGRLADTVAVVLGGAVIGDLMLQVQDAWAQAEVVEQARRTQAELGWALHPAHGGRGYATEAVRALIRVCFEDLGLRRVAANCFAGNTASWRLMERVGMRREMYAVREGLHRSGAWLDSLTYALLADEWRSGALGDRPVSS